MLARLSNSWISGAVRAGLVDTADRRYWCPECGCTCTREEGSDDGTVYAICDDPECTYAFLVEEQTD